MKSVRRQVVAILITCASLLAHAQGYKCKQADGSVSYQDHACAAGTASSSAVPTDLGGGEAFRRGLPPMTSLDGGCQQAAKQALTVCFGAMDTTLKRCQSTSMTATCRAQMNGPRNGPHDEVCAKQALGCLSESLQGTQACFQRELPPACMQQVEAARRKRQR
jgi:hypothetical protein